MCVYMYGGGIGACGIENKHLLFSPIECIDEKQIGVMTTMNIPYGEIYIYI